MSLRHNPAPIYILDEVDAALDLNHTQNIGRMIKEHFPMSQFIIVSLKEGMFNNANVIFRTKFVDGVSNVVRTVNNADGVTAAVSGKGRAEARGVLRERVNV
jgi:structural maintenance of chromosome 2